MSSKLDRKAQLSPSQRRLNFAVNHSSDVQSIVASNLSNVSENEDQINTKTCDTATSGSQETLCESEEDFDEFSIHSAVSWPDLRSFLTIVAVHVANGAIATGKTTFGEVKRLSPYPSHDFWHALRPRLPSIIVRFEYARPYPLADHMPSVVTEAVRAATFALDASTASRHVVQAAAMVAYRLCHEVAVAIRDGINEIALPLLPAATPPHTQLPSTRVPHSTTTRSPVCTDTMSHPYSGPTSAAHVASPFVIQSSPSTAPPTQRQGHPECSGGAALRANGATRGTDVVTTDLGTLHPEAARADDSSNRRSHRSTRGRVGPPEAGRASPPPADASRALKGTRATSAVPASAPAAATATGAAVGRATKGRAGRGGAASGGRGRRPPSPTERATTTPAPSGGGGAWRSARSGVTRGWGCDDGVAGGTLGGVGASSDAAAESLPSSLPMTAMLPSSSISTFSTDAAAAGAGTGPAAAPAAPRWSHAAAAPTSPHAGGQVVAYPPASLAHALPNAAHSVPGAASPPPSRHPVTLSASPDHVAPQHAAAAAPAAAVAPLAPVPSTGTLAVAFQNALRASQYTDDSPRHSMAAAYVLSDASMSPARPTGLITDNVESRVDDGVARRVDGGAAADVGGGAPGPLISGTMDITDAPRPLAVVATDVGDAGYGGSAGAWVDPNVTDAFTSMSPVPPSKRAATASPGTPIEGARVNTAVSGCVISGSLISTTLDPNATIDRATATAMCGLLADDVPAIVALTTDIGRHAAVAAPCPPPSVGEAAAVALLERIQRHNALHGGRTLVGAGGAAARQRAARDAASAAPQSMSLAVASQSHPPTPPRAAGGPAPRPLPPAHIAAGWGAVPWAASDPTGDHGNAAAARFDGVDVTAADVGCSHGLGAGADGIRKGKAAAPKPRGGSESASGVVPDRLASAGCGSDAGLLAAGPARRGHASRHASADSVLASAAATRTPEFVVAALGMLGVYPQPQPQPQVAATHRAPSPAAPGLAAAHGALPLEASADGEETEGLGPGRGRDEGDAEAPTGPLVAPFPAVTPPRPRRGGDTEVGLRHAVGDHTAAATSAVPSTAENPAAKSVAPTPASAATPRPHPPPSGADPVASAVPISPIAPAGQDRRSSSPILTPSRARALLPPPDQSTTSPAPPLIQQAHAPPPAPPLPRPTSPTSPTSAAPSHGSDDSVDGPPEPLPRNPSGHHGQHSADVTMSPATTLAFDVTICRSGDGEITMDGAPADGSAVGTSTSDHSLEPRRGPDVVPAVAQSTAHHQAHPPPLPCDSSNPCDTQGDSLMMYDTQGVPHPVGASDGSIAWGEDPADPVDASVDGRAVPQLPQALGATTSDRDASAIGDNDTTAVPPRSSGDSEAGDAPRASSVVCSLNSVSEPDVPSGEPYRNGVIAAPDTAATAMAHANPHEASCDIRNDACGASGHALTTALGDAMRTAGPTDEGESPAPCTVGDDTERGAVTAHHGITHGQPPRGAELQTRNSSARAAGGGGVVSKAASTVGTAKGKPSAKAARGRGRGSGGRAAALARGAAPWVGAMSNWAATTAAGAGGGAAVLKSVAAVAAAAAAASGSTRKPRGPSSAIARVAVAVPGASPAAASGAMGNGGEDSVSDGSSDADGLGPAGRGGGTASLVLRPEPAVTNISNLVMRHARGPAGPLVHIPPAAPLPHDDVGAAGAHRRSLDARGQSSDSGASCAPQGAPAAPQATGGAAGGSGGVGDVGAEARAMATSPDAHTARHEQSSVRCPGPATAAAVSAAHGATTETVSDLYLPARSGKARGRATKGDGGRKRRGAAAAAAPALSSGAPAVVTPVAAPSAALIMSGIFEARAAWQGAGGSGGGALAGNLGGAVSASVGAPADSPASVGVGSVGGSRGDDEDGEYSSEDQSEDHASGTLEGGCGGVAVCDGDRGAPCDDPIDFTGASAQSERRGCGPASPSVAHNSTPARLIPEPPPTRGPPRAGATTPIASRLHGQGNDPTGPVGPPGLCPALPLTITPSQSQRTVPLPSPSPSGPKDIAAPITDGLAAASRPTVGTGRQANRTARATGAPREVVLPPPSPLAYAAHGPSQALRKASPWLPFTSSSSSSPSPSHTRGSGALAARHAERSRSCSAPTAAVVDSALRATDSPAARRAPHPAPTSTPLSAHGDANAAVCGVVTGGAPVYAASTRVAPPGGVLDASDVSFTHTMTFTLPPLSCASLPETQSQGGADEGASAGESGSDRDDDDDDEMSDSSPRRPPPSPKPLAQRRPPDRLRPPGGLPPPADVGRSDASAVDSGVAPARAAVALVSQFGGSSCSGGSSAVIVAGRGGAGWPSEQAGGPASAAERGGPPPWRRQRATADDDSASSEGGRGSDDADCRAPNARARVHGPVGGHAEGDDDDAAWRAGHRTRAAAAPRGATAQLPPALHALLPTTLAGASGAPRPRVRHDLVSGPPPRLMRAAGDGDGSSAAFAAARAATLGEAASAAARMADHNAHPAHGQPGDVGGPQPTGVPYRPMSDGALAGVRTLLRGGRGGGLGHGMLHLIQREALVAGVGGGAGAALGAVGTNAAGGYSGGGAMPGAVGHAAGGGLYGGYGGGVGGGGGISFAVHASTAVGAPHGGRGRHHQRLPTPPPSRVMPSFALGGGGGPLGSAGGGGGCAPPTHTRGPHGPLSFHQPHPPAAGPAAAGVTRATDAFDAGWAAAAASAAPNAAIVTAWCALDPTRYTLGLLEAVGAGLPDALLEGPAAAAASLASVTVSHFAAACAVGGPARRHLVAAVVALCESRGIPLKVGPSAAVGVNGGGGGGAGPGFAGDGSQFMSQGDELSAPVVTLSSRCAVSLKPIRIPVRSRTCRHPQPHDATTLVPLIRNRATRAVAEHDVSYALPLVAKAAACPTCRALVSPGDLSVDLWFAMAAHRAEGGTESSGIVVPQTAEGIAAAVGVSVDELAGVACRFG